MKKRVKRRSKNSESVLIKERKKRLHKAFVKILLDYPVTNIKFSRNRLSLTFFNKRISDKIDIKRVNHVAEWSRRRREIFIDQGFGNREKERSFRALCIHELIERFLAKEFGLKVDDEAHIVATKKEREYLESVKGNWRSHELEVFWDWHKYGDH